MKTKNCGKSETKKTQSTKNCSGKTDKSGAKSDEKDCK